MKILKRLQQPFPGHCDYRRKPPQYENGDLKDILSIADPESFDKLPTVAKAMTGRQDDWENRSWSLRQTQDERRNFLAKFLYRTMADTAG